MKLLLTVVLAVSFSVSAAAETCAQSRRAVEKDMEALGTFFQGRRPEHFHRTMETKSKKPLEMIREFLVAEYKGEAAEIAIKKNTKAIPSWAQEAGTTTETAAMNAVMGTAEYWFLRDGTKEEKAELRAKIQAAADELFGHDLAYGYDASVQGWGGSEATNLLLIDTECKLLYTFFLGITHD